MSDNRTTTGMLADGEWLTAARHALDFDQDTETATAAALIAIAEVLEAVVSNDGSEIRVLER